MIAATNVLIRDDTGRFQPRVGLKITVDDDGVTSSTGNQTMRLTINTIHTYYLIAGETPVLVHNCGGPRDNKYKYPEE